MHPPVCCSTIGKVGLSQNAAGLPQQCRIGFACRQINLFGKIAECKIEALPVNPRTNRVCYKMTCVKIASSFDPAARAHQQSMIRLADLKTAIAQVTTCTVFLQCCSSFFMRSLA